MLILCSHETYFYQYQCAQPVEWVLEENTSGIGVEVQNFHKNTIFDSGEILNAKVVQKDSQNATKMTSHFDQKIDALSVKMTNLDTSAPFPQIMGRGPPQIYTGYKK